MCPVFQEFVLPVCNFCSKAKSFTRVNSCHSDLIETKKDRDEPILLILLFKGAQKNSGLWIFVLILDH